MPRTFKLLFGKYKKYLPSIIFGVLVLLVVVFPHGRHVPYKTHPRNRTPILTKKINSSTKYAVSSSTPQYVLLAFDGAKSVEMMNNTLDFSRTMSLQKKPVHFTYFVNAAYFLTPKNAALYTGPRHVPGQSNIGFADSEQDIADRVHGFNTAFNEGHEVASHAVGHFDGSLWSVEEWQQEFTSFNEIMAHIQQNNTSVQIEKPKFLSEIYGFRAPNLGFNDNLFNVESKFNFLYDSSGMSYMSTWPVQDQNGIWRINLAVIPVGFSRKPILSMDYNMWIHQSGGINDAVKGSDLWQSDFNEVKDAYINYFNKNYNGSRAPIVIGNHFSNMNDWVYWEAMKSFAEDVCGKPYVRCTTFKELVDYLNETGAPPIIK